MTIRSKTMTIVIAVAAGVLFAPLDIVAQQAEKVYRIGYLGTSSGIQPPFRQRLKELGYVEGKNLTIEFRRRTRTNRLAIAQEMVRLKVNLILTVGTETTRIASQATSTIPIVMGNSSADPVRQGLVASLTRPGGNVTGLFDLMTRLAGKRVEILKEIFPGISRIVHLSPPGTVAKAHLKATQAAAGALGIHVNAVTVGSPRDLEKAIRSATEGGAQAAIVTGISFFIRHRPRIVKLAAKYRLPTMYTHGSWVPLGGFVAYTSDQDARYRRAAEYVDQILKGAKPADLPVEQPQQYLLQVNLKAAKALGVTVPRSILLRATEIIE